VKQGWGPASSWSTGRSVLAVSRLCWRQRLGWQVNDFAPCLVHLHSSCCCALSYLRQRSHEHMSRMQWEPWYRLE
jgi:hypothetical protein